MWTALAIGDFELASVWRGLGNLIPLSSRRVPSLQG